MKIKILVAFIATAMIIFLSCNWFQSQKKQAANPLVGEWKIDSISFEKDTTLPHVINAVAENHSSNAILSITKDFIFSLVQTDVVDSIAYSFDEKVNRILTADSAQTLGFAKINDSLISLTTKDSAIIFLKKK